MVFYKERRKKPHRIPTDGRAGADDCTGGAKRLQGHWRISGSVYHGQNSGITGQSGINNPNRDRGGTVQNKRMQWVIRLIRQDMNYFIEEVGETPGYCIETYKEMIYRERQKDELQRSDRKGTKR